MRLAQSYGIKIEGGWSREVIVEGETLKIEGATT
jgi:hypothetical protein